MMDGETVLDIARRNPMDPRVPSWLGVLALAWLINGVWYASPSVSDGRGFFASSRKDMVAKLAEVPT